MGRAIRTHSLSKKKNSLLRRIGPPTLPPKWFTGRAWLVVAWRRIREEIGGVELRAIPQFVEVAMKLIGAGLGDVVHLRRSVAPLIDRIRQRVHGHLGDGVQAEDQIGGKSAVQIRERIVGLEAVHDVARSIARDRPLNWTLP